MIYGPDDDYRLPGPGDFGPPVCPHCHLEDCECPDEEDCLEEGVPWWMLEDEG